MAARQIDTMYIYITNESTCNLVSTQLYISNSESGILKMAFNSFKTKVKFDSCTYHIILYVQSV